MAEAARGGDAHDLVSRINGLFAHAIRIRVVDLHVDQLHAGAALLVGQRRALADEVFLVEPEEALHRGLDHIDLGCEFRAPAAIALLHAQRIHRIGAEQPDAMGLSRGHQRIEDLGHAGHGHMQFPAELAHIVDAEQPHAIHTRHRGGLAGEPAEGRVGKIGRGARAQHLTRQRPGEDEHAIAIGHVGDRHLLIIALAPVQLVEIVQLGNGR